MAKINQEKLVELYRKGKSDIDLAEYFNCSVRTIQANLAILRKKGIINYREEDEILQENLKLTKKNQKQTDQIRISKKVIREQSRVDNAVVELNSELLNILKKYELPKKLFDCKKIRSNKKAGAILQLSDLHLNELVNLSSNKYDFTVASQRIKKFVDDAKDYLKAKNVKDICVAFTGDLMNSDRRLDELLSQATNRSKALFLSISILEQALLDLDKDFNISVVSVIGNESRMTKEIGWVEEIASDNYDYIIHNVLKLLFRNSKIQFFGGKSTEQVVEIVGQNTLVVHGNQVSGNKMESKIQSIIGKYAHEKILIDYVISGHLHSARASDLFARSSSLVGANAYSRDALQLASRASQNLHLFYSDGNRDSIVIGLQHVSDIKGYPINKELEAYNAKSAGKAKKKTVIHKIVI